MALRVDAATPRAPRQLRVFAGRERDVGRAVPLGQRLDDDGARGHVDAQRQRLGRVHHLDQALGKQMLNGLLHEGQHARVVGGDATHQPVLPRVNPEHDRILGGDQRDDLVDVALDCGRLRARRERDAGEQHLAHGVLAPGARKDKRDRREQVGPIQRDERGGTRLAAHAHGSVPRARAAPTPHPRVVRGGHQLGVQLALAGGRVQVEDLLPHDHVLVEGNRTALGDDDLARGANLADPRAKLLGVGHGRRQSDDRHVSGQVDDHFLPHGPAHLIGQIVHLVQDDDSQVIQGHTGVDHVARHLGRHDDDGGLGVNRRVAGGQADVVRPVELAQLQVFLVRQRLNGRRVEGAHAALKRHVGTELADDRLARARGRRDQDGVAGLDGVERVDLEGVGGKAQPRDPASAQGRGRPRVFPEGRVSLGGTALAHARAFLGSRGVGDALAVSASFRAHG